MAQSLRVIVYNCDESYSAALRAPLLKHDRLKIVAEVDESALLPHTVSQFPADVLVVNLDPSPDTNLTMAGEIAASHHDLSVIVVSQVAEGQIVLQAMRLGIRTFLTKPIDQQLLDDALDQVARKSMNGLLQGKLITILGGAGGVGATSVSVNLAVELKHLCPGPVALVDLDYRFGQVGTLLDIDPLYTIADLCDTPEALETQIVERALVKHGSGVNVLCRPTTFTQADNITAAHCARVLTSLLTMHEYVVVDGPTRFEVSAKAVLDLADCNLLLMQLLVPCVRNVHRIIGGMESAGFSTERLRIICNRVGKESGALTQHDVESTLNTKVFCIIPDDAAAMHAAINLGEPLATTHPKSKARLAIKELAERLHSPTAETDDKEATRKSGLLSKIFSDG